MPRKKKTIAKLVDDAAVILQRVVRIKAANDDGYCQCVSCGTKKHYKEMHGGHFIPRTCTELKLMEENIHPQCPGCNTFNQEKAKVTYTLFMVDTYGREFVDELDRIKKSGQPKKYSRPEIEGIIEDLKHYEKCVIEQAPFL